MIPVKCVAPGCRTIVRDPGHSRCELHRKKQKGHANKVRAEQRKVQNKAKSFIYNTASWKRLSIKKRTVDLFCEECLLQNPVIYKQADVVDHIVELTDGGEPYLWTNLRSLCHACHNRKTAQEKKKRKRNIV